MITYKVDGDDESQNVGRQVFEVANPRLHIFASQDTLITSGDFDLLPVSYTEQQGVVNNSSVFALAFNDSGIAQDMTVNDNGAVIYIESEGAGAELWSNQQVGGANSDDSISLEKSVELASADAEAKGGIYHAYVAPEDKTGQVSVEFASQFDDNSISNVLLEIVEPTGVLTIFPGGIDISKNYGKLTVMAVVLDQYGRSIEGLTSKEDHLVFEIDGDERSHSSYNMNNVHGELYFVDYSSDETGLIPVNLLYNDTRIAEGQFYVVDDADLTVNPNTYNENYNFNYSNFAYNEAYNNKAADENVTN